MHTVLTGSVITCSPDGEQQSGWMIDYRQMLARFEWGEDCQLCQPRAHDVATGRQDSSVCIRTA